MSEDERPRGRDAAYTDPRVDDRVAHRFEDARGGGVVCRVDGDRVRVMGDGWADWFRASELYLMRSITAAEIIEDHRKRAY